MADAFIRELAQYDAAMATRVTDATKAGKVRPCRLRRTQVCRACSAGGRARAAC